MSQIKMDGGDTDEAIGHGVAIASGDIIKAKLRSSEPVIRLVSGVDFLHHVAAVVASSQFGDEPLGLGVNLRREVDVHENASGHSRAQKVGGNGGDLVECGIEVMGATAGKAEGDGGNVAEGCLDSGGDGTAVHDIISKVCAVIDAGDAESGAAVGEEVIEANVDAVRGCPGDSVMAGPAMTNPEGVAEADGVADGALLGGGGDDPDFAKRLDGPGEGVDAVGVDAVVIGDKNQWPFHV